MRKLKKICIIVGVLVIGLPIVLLAIAFAIGCCLYFTADFRQPDFTLDMSKYEVVVEYKVEGPSYVKGSTRKDGAYIGRVFFLEPKAK